MANNIAQLIAPAVQEATSPFQFGSNTKAGGECVAHAIESLTNLNNHATILSIDGMSAMRHDIESCDVGWTSPNQ